MKRKILDNFLYLQENKKKTFSFIIHNDFIITQPGKKTILVDIPNILTCCVHLALYFVACSPFLASCRYKQFSLTFFITSGYF